ncbi:MAG: hypothetical protein ABIE94_00605, partial [archaeon]
MSKRSIEHIVKKETRKNPKMKSYDMVYLVMIVSLILVISFGFDYIHREDLAGRARTAVEGKAFVLEVYDKYDQRIDGQIITEKNGRYEVDVIIESYVGEETVETGFKLEDVINPRKEELEFKISFLDKDKKAKDNVMIVTEVIASGQELVKKEADDKGLAGISGRVVANGTNITDNETVPEEPEINAPEDINETIEQEENITIEPEINVTEEINETINETGGEIPIEEPLEEVVEKLESEPELLEEIVEEPIEVLDDGISFSKATITLAVEPGKKVKDIYKCSDFDFFEFECIGKWEKTGIPFEVNKDNNLETITFEVDGFSAYAGGDEEAPLAGEYNFVSTHPSIFITPEKVVTIRSRCGFADDGTTQFNDASYECGKLQDQMSSFPVLNNAFMYLLTGDTSYSDYVRNTINAEYASYPLPDGSPTGLSWGAGVDWDHWHYYFPIAYDWVYDELTPTEQANWHAKIVEVAEASYIRYDFKTEGTGANTYHTAIAESLQELLFSMASRDAKYGDNSRENLLDVFIPAFNELGTLEKGGYTPGYPNMLALQLQAWNTATDEDLFSQATFVQEWPIFMYYVSYDNPEAGYSPALLFHGDGTDPGGEAYWGGRGYICAMAEYTNDPISWQYTDDIAISVPSSPRDWWVHITFCDYDAPRAEIPLDEYSKYFDPGNTVIMRTGFTMDQQNTDILAKYGISYWVYSHGEDADAGHFDLIRGQDRLLGDNRFYSSHGTGYWENWQARSVAHNVLLACDPSEDFGPHSNDCGQTPLSMLGSPVNYIQSPATGNPIFERGYIEKFENTDDYTISSADLTDAYSNKINSYQREITYLKPDVFVIFDRADTSDSSFDTKVVWHMIEDPVISGNHLVDNQNPSGGTPGDVYDGNLITITRENSRAYVKTLLPNNIETTKIGGPTDFSDSGTATSVVNQESGYLAVSLTDPTKNWDVNWLTHCAVTNNGNIFEILSNTGNTIYVSDTINYYNPLATGPYSISCRYFWQESFEAYSDGTNYLATSVDTKTASSVQIGIEKHGAWRTEIKDTASTTEHYFLSVIHATDSAGFNINSQLIEDADSYGALVETETQDFIVMFGKQSILDSVSYTIPVSITGSAINVINNLQPN